MISPVSPERARWIAITSCLLMAIRAFAAPEQTANPITEIRSVLQAQQDAWNRGDIDGFMNGYAPLGIDCLYFGGHSQAGLGNCARSLQRKIFQPFEDGDAYVF